ncbi:MAG TPA: hypothetical protein VF884_12110 [Nitrososphaeraceae archaeon]
MFRPEDLGRGYRKIIENAIRDLNPNTKDNVIKVFSSWDGTNSRKKLNEMLGFRKAEELLRRVKEYDDPELTDEERKTIKDIFKDSLTFD